MQFALHTPRRRPSENIVPMINVVFLLLIFFLMSAQIAPPDPIEVALPISDATAPPAQEATLFVAADGALAYGAARGDGVWTALQTHEGVLSLRVDASFPANSLAALLPKLAAQGVTGVALVTGAAP